MAVPIDNSKKPTIRIELVKPSAYAEPATARQAGKPKLSFGSLKTAAPASAPKSSKYPVLPDSTGKIAIAVKSFLDAQAAEEAATGAKEAARAELIAAARPYHFRANAGKPEAASSVLGVSDAGEVRITFKDAYKKLYDLAPVRGIIGETVDAHFSESFEFKINSDLIPADKLQETIDEVNKLSAKLQLGDALKVVTCYKPVAEFHAARYRNFTAEQNIAIENAVDPDKGFCTVAVTTAKSSR